MSAIVRARTWIRWKFIRNRVEIRVTAARWRAPSRLRDSGNDTRGCCRCHRAQSPAGIYWNSDILSKLWIFDGEMFRITLKRENIIFDGSRSIPEKLSVRYVRNSEAVDSKRWLLCMWQFSPLIAANQTFLRQVPLNLTHYCRIRSGAAWSPAFFVSIIYRILP